MKQVQDRGETIRSLNDEEYEKLLDAMKKHEGWREGREEYNLINKVFGVHVNKKKTIFEFLIGDGESFHWISKDEAVVLAERGELFAVVVHSKGMSYIRPKFHQKSFRQMILTFATNGQSAEKKCCLV